jgi:hypothetical protein
VYKIISISITLVLLLGTFTILSAQNVEFQLGGKTNAEKFEIKDSDGNVLFQLKGNGKIGLGSAVLKNSKMHVQGSINAQGVYKIQGSTVLSKKGTKNTFVGESAGAANTSGLSNTFIGRLAGYSNMTGTENTFIGRDTGADNITGNLNTYIGAGAGNNGSGSYNVFLGHEAGFNEFGSSRLYIDNSSTSSPLIWGDFSNDRVVINGNSTHNTNNRTFFSNGAAGGTTGWYNDSDGRMKKNITTINQALEKVQNLRGVNFEWKETEHHEEGLQMGFIAQEVEEVIPEVVSNGGDSYSMQYSPLTALLVEAVKEQQQIINNQNQEITNLKDRLEVIESLVRFTVNN